MVPINEIFHTSLNLLPLTTFLIGLSGSAHCVGMCGGIVAASTDKTKKSNVLYQLGRLLGYMALGLTTSFAGRSLLKDNSIEWISILSSLLIGLMLIWWAFKIYTQKEITFKFPLFFQKMTHRIWQNKLKAQSKSYSNLRAFSIGSLSIFLPCGLLYGVVVALAAFENIGLTALSIFGFWLGTTPSMFFAPEIGKKILSPLTKKSPKISSLLLLIVGLATIAHRFYTLSTGESCH